MTFQTNPTQCLGLAVFALAAIACARTAKLRGRAPWRGLAWVQVLAFAEVGVGLRLRVHDWADSLLRNEGWYASRSSLQWPLLLAIATLFTVWVIGVSVRRTRRREPWTRLAVLGSSLSLALFAVEVVSLHALDALFYARVGPFLVVGTLWAAAAGITALAAWMAGRA